MCGIVAAINKKGVTDFILEGLRQLEYRGYDSAGMATLGHQGLQTCKVSGKIKRLTKSVEQKDIEGGIGIGHTRWATHGKPTKENAHPHVSHDQIAVVHNGIIENHLDIKQELQALGYTYVSDTDTETIAHAAHRSYSESGNFFSACQQTIRSLRGSYALAMVCAQQPDTLVAAKKGCPLIIGINRGGGYCLASDISALNKSCERFVYLEDGDTALIKEDGYRIFDHAGQSVFRVAQKMQMNAEEHGKKGYPHYMIKEIFEQPEVAAAAIHGRVVAGRIASDFLSKTTHQALQDVEQVHIVACGSSWHAGMMAQYWLEGMAQIPCHVEIASEYRYRKPAVPKNTLFIAISQSGETADTLAALQFAKKSGYVKTLAICNVENSSMHRLADETVLTRAGVEVGVASTKALTSQLMVLALLSLHICEIKKSQSRDQINQWVDELLRIPVMINQALCLDKDMEKLAQTIAAEKHIIFVGRGVHYPVAMEAALKLKEISYIHAEAYAAGELKHGPLALIDESKTVITAFPNDALKDKMLSNLMEIQSRGGRIHALADVACKDMLTEVSDSCVHMKSSGLLMSPIVFNVPFQLLAYHAAVLCDNDVDQPRNLAKSVTVE